MRATVRYRAKVKALAELISKKPGLDTLKAVFDECEQCLKKIAKSRDMWPLSTARLPDAEDESVDSTRVAEKNDGKVDGTKDEDEEETVVVAKKSTMTPRITLWSTVNRYQRSVPREQVENPNGADTLGLSKVCGEEKYACEQQRALTREERTAGVASAVLEAAMSDEISLPEDWIRLQKLKQLVFHRSTSTKKKKPGGKENERKAGWWLVDDPTKVFGVEMNFGVESTPAVGVMRTANKQPHLDLNVLLPLEPNDVKEPMMKSGGKGEDLVVDQEYGVTLFPG
ncbi:unnamed protein product [Amoebophrya sp. A25]|nr:unnamed protein product [Amoebophrya sp. A25]|eukprot:GSA25T00003628001.1